MEALLEEIIAELRSTDTIGTTELAAIIRTHNRSIHDVSQHLSKKKALRRYLRERNGHTELWRSWGIDDALDARIVKTLQMKPRRTASGVATITVITKPASCSSNCLYCPNDVRMPKSYLTDEPACQRAERNFFDPYLQVTSRLRALTEMGHETDKIELIVLGGTWSDYPENYQLWFAAELFRALNDGAAAPQHTEQRRRAYREAGLTNDPADLAQAAASLQARVNDGQLTYNQAVEQLYGTGSPWEPLQSWQTATFEDLEAEHARNENARHRVVGLVVETRPDTMTAESLSLIRRIGCTKVQMGIQTLDPALIRANNRATAPEDVKRAFALLRLFGFKIHAHFMVNLYGSNPQADLRDYRQLVEEPAYRPDEVKLYPCVLVHGTGLCRCHEEGSWAPYPEEELVRVLAEDVLATPPYLRISRMIRDISAHDIVAGSKKTNLRQMVEQTVLASGRPVNEIRLREISTDEVRTEDLSLRIEEYATSVSDERFLQWVTPSGKIAGFLRLSLPHAGAVDAAKTAGGASFPIERGEAMIREVHVYGRVAKLHTTGFGAQHLGLGRQLVERACEIAHEAGYERINVISAIGTREYYRNLGFEDNSLYQQRAL